MTSQPSPIVPSMSKDDVTAGLIHLFSQNKPGLTRGEHVQSTVLMIEELIEELTTKIRNLPESLEASPVRGFVEAVRQFFKQLESSECAPTPAVSIPSISVAISQASLPPSVSANLNPPIISQSQTSVEEPHSNAGLGLSATQQHIQLPSLGANASGTQAGDGRNIHESHISYGNNGSEPTGESTRGAQINPDDRMRFRGDREGSASTVAIELCDAKDQGIGEVEVRPVLERDLFAYN